MKLINIETLISRGGFPRSATWQSIKKQLQEEIAAIDWPHGSGKFTIYPESGKKRGEGNGVKPIKEGFIGRLEELGWKSEEPLDIATRKKPGAIDAVFYSGEGAVALEWETGNISSSHRAINKLCLGMLKGCIVAGVLVVPSRKLYPFLTDRIGNFDELEPYLDLWRAVECEKGVLEIFVVEHDEESLDVPRIPKGTDGRALA